MNLNMDPNILLGIVNLKLRDFFKNLDDLVYDLDISKDDLIQKLSTIGYSYDEKINQFIQKDA